MTRHANKPHIDRTTNDLQEMELFLGPSPRIGSTFRDDEHRRQLWFENRPRLMALFACDGRRPQGWWKFESKIPYPGFNLERSTLFSAGLLEAEEARELEAHWYEEFQPSLEPGFTFRERSGFLTGFDAHIAHLVFHDVPPDLAEQWATPTAA